MEQVLSLLEVQFVREGAPSIPPVFFTEFQESVGYRDIHTHIAAQAWPRRAVSGWRRGLGPRTQACASGPVAFLGYREDEQTDPLPEQNCGIN